MKLYRYLVIICVMQTPLLTNADEKDKARTPMYFYNPPVPQKVFFLPDDLAYVPIHIERWEINRMRESGWSITGELKRSYASGIVSLFWLTLLLASFLKWWFRFITYRPDNKTGCIKLYGGIRNQFVILHFLIVTGMIGMFAYFANIGVNRGSLLRCHIYVANWVWYLSILWCLVAIGLTWYRTKKRLTFSPMTVLLAIALLLDHLIMFFCVPVLLTCIHV